VVKVLGSVLKEEEIVGAIRSRAGRGFTRVSPIVRINIGRLTSSFDPYHNVQEEQRKQVLGGQVSLWAEQVRHQLGITIRH
jgi:hypothetical protein